jgi:CHAT domain-containing protein/Tfp pilus assembly protein PilF
MALAASNAASVPGAAAIVRALALVAVLVAAARADDTPEQAVAKILTAHSSGNEERLAALATRPNPDPWLIADLLCAQGHPGAALALVDSAGPVHARDIVRLDEYVKSWREGDEELETRSAIARASALSGSKPEQVLGILAEVSPRNPVLRVQVLFAKGQALFQLKRFEESSKTFYAAADAAAKLGWLRHAASACSSGIEAAARRGDHRASLSGCLRLVDIGKRRNHAWNQAIGLVNAGAHSRTLGDYEGAHGYLRQALALARKIKSVQLEAAALGRLGSLSRESGDPVGALEYQRRALVLFEQANDGLRAAAARANMAASYADVGEFRGALESHALALRAFERAGREDLVAIALLNMGVAETRLGNYAEALAHYEAALRLARELQDHYVAADALHGIATVRADIGDLDAASKILNESLRLTEEKTGDAHVTTRILLDLANIAWRQGRYGDARAVIARARPLLEELKDRGGLALLDYQLARLSMAQGDIAQAERELAKAIEGFDEVGSSNDVARAWTALARIHADKGDYAGARSLCKQVLDRAERSGDQYGRAVGLSGLAEADLADGNPKAALERARRAVRCVSDVVESLSDSGESSARRELSSVYSIGTKAAVEMKSPTDVCWFLESGRSGALLEALRLQDATREAALSPALLEADRAARAREAAAVRAFRRASEGNGDMTAAKAELAAARALRGDVIGRIQREAKASAALLYPNPTDLTGIEESLRENEAMVFYSFCETRIGNELVALVVTPGAARVVKLGDPSAVRRLVERLHLDRTGAMPGNTRQRLCEALVDPLGLEATVTRVLISPEDVLAYLPFAWLLQDREVLCVPSGTVYCHLAARSTKPGNGILALGDPDYDVRPSPSVTLQRGEDWLARVPYTGAEAKAIGTLALTGPSASESRLVEEASKQRWHAIHLACHGLIDSENPELSALAVSPDGNNDGFLTVLDVFRLRLRSDLVVLSACRTGRGKIIRGEGVLGFTRAFMFAGAPRVIVSLWKVNDEATQALMVKFYELWKGGEETATALRKAQEFVRGQEKWKHPYYWAAWQLWGLGD